MRPYLAVPSLLLTCLLLSMALGIRLDKMFMSSPGQHKQVHEAEGNALITKGIDFCKDGQCSGIRNKEKEKQRKEEKEEIKGITPGKNRKLFNTASTSTTTNPTSKNEKNVENENFRVNPRPAFEHYDMDHPPKQKPPIHH